MNKFYVVNGETLEPAITVTPTYVDANILEVDKAKSTLLMTIFGSHLKKLTMISCRTSNQ